MGWDGAGAYTRQHNFSADASVGIKILAARMDQEFDDFASAMTIALTRNGQNVPTQNLPMGGFRHINVGAPTSINNYMRSREFVENVPIFMQDQESSADRISVSAQYFTSVSANQAPADGTGVLVRVNSDKSSAVLYLNGHSANVINDDGDKIEGGALTSGGIYRFIYSSAETAWRGGKPKPFFGRTAAEATAGVTPTTYQYPEGDVRRYGALGDGSTDDTTAIQNAFNVAKVSLGRVHFPALDDTQTVYLCASISVYEGTNVTADDGVVIEKNAGASTTHVFDCVSTLTTATTLTANAAVRATSVDVTSVAGLSAGQLVLIRDNTFKFTTNGRNLELNEIESIASLTVTLKNRLIGSYTTAQSAELVPVTVPARRIKFENVKCRIPSGQDGGAFYFQEAYDCSLVNCGSTGQKGQAGVTTWRAAYIRIIGGDYSDGQDQGTPGYGYGIAIAQSSHGCVARGVTTRNVRENAISLGSRFCKFVDCDAYSTYDSSFNTHADGCEDNDFVNCRSFFARSKGFYAGGVTAQAPDKRTRFIGCKSFYSGYFGYWADGASGVESEDIAFIDCEAFHFGDDTATSYGFHTLRSTRPRLINCRAFANGETNARALVKAEICSDVVIRGCVFRGATNGWGIIHANCTGIVIDDNSIGDIGSAQGVHAESTASTKVIVRRNKVDNDVAFTQNSGDVHEFNEFNTKRQYNKGATSVADGGTVTHGLIGTPTSVRVTGSVSGEFVSVTAKGATTFTLAIKQHDNSAGTTQTVYWEADY